MPHRLIRPFLLFFPLLLTGCDDLTVTYLAFATWGGEHISLVITVTGADVEYDCAQGEILEPIQPINGRFSVLALHQVGTGGPVGIDPVEHPRPARYDGVVEGDQMTVTVTLTDKNERLGVFELIGGAEPHLVKCL